MFSPGFCLGESQGPFPVNWGPAGAKAGQSYLRSMTGVEKALHDFSVHLIKELSNWNSCNGGPSTIL